ncbi:MAG TPA: hypothetical protein VF494_11620 [Candidatus Limnocylindrales bacterium]
MGFLQRLLHKPPASEASSAPDESRVEPADDDADERAYELELLKGEQERLSELAQRQLRYAKDAWQPPAQGGDRRADDHDTPR